MAKLGEVCLLKAGKFVSANDISPEYNKGLYPCFGGNGIRGYVADYTHDGEFPLIGRQGALCGNVNLASGKFHATEHAVVVQPKTEMNVQWLYYALNAMNLGQYATGAAQPGLAVSKLETLSIEIPNISEQNKIAQTLYKVEQLVNFRKQQLAKLDELVKARFVEMFGDPVSNPLHWKKVKLSELADIKIGPFGSLLHKEDYVTGGHPLVNPSHIINGKIIVDDDLTLTEGKYFELSAYRLKKNDVVLGRRGEMGRCAVVDEEGLLCGTGSLLIRTNGTVTADYIQKIISFPTFKKTIEDMAVGQTMPNLNVPIVSNFMIIVPPLSVQKDYYDFVECVDQQKQTVQQSLEKLELMKKALMQEYFG